MPVRHSAKTPTVASYEKNRINRQSIRKKNKQNIYYNVCPRNTGSVTQALASRCSNASRLSSLFRPSFRRSL